MSGITKEKADGRPLVRTDEQGESIVLLRLLQLPPLVTLGAGLSEDRRVTSVLTVTAGFSRPNQMMTFFASGMKEGLRCTTIAATITRRENERRTKKEKRIKSPPLASVCTKEPS